MTNYIIPSSTPTSETLDLSSLMFPCRITDLRNGSEYVLETAEGNAIPLAPVVSMPAGDTASRPGYSDVSSIPYFDTTLGKAIWYNGTEWVDASGTTVV